MTNKFQNCNNFTGGHLNLGNARAATPFLNNTIVKFKYDFFSLNEPYSFEDHITGIPINYTIIAHNRAPKAAIIIKSIYNSQVIFINIEIIILLANIYNQDFLLVSAYCPPSQNIDDNLHIISSFLSNKNLDFNQLPAGELNTHIKQIQESIYKENAYKPTLNNNSQYKKRTNDIWWTSELEIKKKKTIARRRRFQKEKGQQLRTIKKTIFKKNLAEYKKLILITKRTKFKEFITSITNSNIFGRNYNILANKKKRSSINKPIINQDGILSESTLESVNNILDYHFPWTDGQRTPSSCIQPFNFPNYTPLTCKEVESVITQIKPRKAVGTDGLPGEIIKEIFLVSRVWFTDLLNHLLKNGIFPAAWKIARIVLLDKDNKSLDYPSHFRPICVLPCWGKILDKITTNRLSYHLESNHLLSENQFGFRKNRSTILALKNILDFHRAENNNNHLTCLISIYMANAFNAVDWNILLDKIDNLNIPTYLKEIIANFLNNRSVILQQQHKNYNKGIPQGSSLGPILWNIFINEFLQLDFSKNIKVQAFADDQLIMIKAPASYCFTNDRTVIQPHSLSHHKPIIPPWNSYSISWTLFNKDLQGVLIFTDGSKMNQSIRGLPQQHRS
ncbi:uncharacterized protein CDAR_530971 [Caerostris darwini]|uniref:Reverse transcriptase domain-containing protein n=1 Tax=Caerostris darwini TaxID=1538125 RepID=A0AAV4VVI9_9ARAC|nr:uncharacterized protein CDAR_530971 [Caerostris darwini]